MVFEKESAVFEKELPRLLGESAGKFVLIHGDKIIGTFGTYEDALQEGYKLFSPEDFFVKQILPAEHIQFVSRDIVCLA